MRQHSTQQGIIIISWVDDLILAADNMNSLNSMKRMLTSEFKMKKNPENSAIFLV